MNVQAVLIPLFVQVALTFCLAIHMAILRRRALWGGDVQPDDISLGQQKWPTPATQAANAFRNQLELPILFYVLCILAMITRQADNLFVVLAWVFVISRLVHAYVHITYNKLTHRSLIFALGCFTLMVMWVLFAIDVVIGV